MEAFETSEQNMYTDAGKLGEICRPPKYCYGDHFPPVLLEGLEIYWEHRHRYKRAKLARRGKPPRTQRRQSVPAPSKLQMEENHRVISLTDVTILLKVGGKGGETTVGTLEADVNGIQYMSSSFHTHFAYKDIKTAIYGHGALVGDKWMPPLVHFHLHTPIMMGTVEAVRDIQFHLVQCPVEEKRSDHDLDKIEKENQIRDEGRDGDLMRFVSEVGDRWSSLEPDNVFSMIQEEYKFYGFLPSKVPAPFAMTFFYLVVLLETPFVVIPMRDIEIVNLALLRPGEIDMTVIYRDFKGDNVFEIRSIPLRMLDRITRRLDHVLYYVNAEKLDWKSIVENKAKFPEKFIENGGWDQFKLEDSTYYKETEEDLKCFAIVAEER